MGAPRQDEDLSERLFKALLDDFRDHADGTRPVHAVGIGAEGYFVPSDVAPSFSTAEHFAGARVPVTVRFSNGTGSPVERDDALDVRGMATKFHLPSGTDADLIMVTMPVFFAATPTEFLGVAIAGIQQPVRPQTWWERFTDQLRLRPPAPPPPPGGFSGAPGVIEFANHHPSSRPGIVAALMAVAPTSYARAAYHALHTFELTGADGAVRYGRFTWEPVAGVRPHDDPDAPNDHLRTELGPRLARGPVRFVLRMVLAGQGDALDNPAKSWDTTRRRIVMGELVLTGLVADQESECERLSFNPTRTVPGFEPSDDPVLAARRGAYELSCRERGGSGCPVGGDR